MADLEIFVFILGDSPASKNMFSIIAQEGTTISTWKRRLHAEGPSTFKRCRAADLTLWKLNVPIPADDVDEAVATLGQDLSEVAVEMLPAKKISHYFTVPPIEESLHVIVVLSPILKRKHGDSDSPDSMDLDTRLAKRREHTNNVLQGLVPSSVTPSKVQRLELKARPVYNRPPLPQTIPLALLHDVFGKFMHDVQEYKPTQSDYQFLSDLREKMVEVYPKEGDRCAAFRAVCEKHELGGGVLSLLAASVGTASYQTDGDLRLHGRMLLVTEGKNEWEHMNADPVLQAAMYHITAVKGMTDDEFNNDNFPCLLVYYAGSFIGFAGCLISDLPQVELLTPFFPFNTNTHETEMSSQLARALGALRLAVESLKSHYGNWRQPQMAKVGDGDGSSRERQAKLFYPYKTCYGNTVAPIDFRYLKRMDSTKLLFLCETTTTTTTRKLCVKFTRKYCKDAHQHSATNGVAPELYAVESLPGGWIMVVMEYLDENSYEPLLTSRVPRVNLVQEVRRVVGVLHAGGFVHGDVRDVNLMVHRNWSETGAKKVLLVDFDWAGSTGLIRYPPNVNRVEIPRPDGASDGELISKEHDLWMVEQLVGPRVGQYSVAVDNATLPLMDISQ